MDLVSLLIAVLVLCVVIWAVNYLMAAFSLPSQIQAVVYVLIVLFVVLWIVGLLGGGPSLRLGR